MPGLDKSVLDSVSWNSVIPRIQRDITTDLILAPHYSAIFQGAGPDLADRAYKLLRSGEYQPELPLTISVPKRWGFTRPGSILTPVDRLVYHALGEAAASEIEGNLDRTRAFSHVWLSPSEGDALFQPEGQCWS